jgi:hypothetical protein
MKAFGWLIDKWRLPDNDQVVTAWWENRAYNLARYFPAQEKSINDVFYECDNFSIYCHAVFREQFDGWSDDDKLNPPYISAADGSLSLYIRGERVYTYPLERKQRCPGKK